MTESSAIGRTPSRVAGALLLSIPYLPLLLWAVCLPSVPLILAFLALFFGSFVGVLQPRRLLRRAVIVVDLLTGIVVLQAMCSPWTSPLTLPLIHSSQAANEDLKLRILRYEPDPAAIQTVVTQLGTGPCCDHDQAAWLVGSVNRYEREHANSTQFPNGVRSLNSRVIGPLRAMMRSRDSWDHVHASAALKEMGPDASPAVSELIAGLQEGEGTVGWNCAEALGHIGMAAEPAVPALLRSLATLPAELPYGGESSLRRKIVRALGKIGPGARAAVPVLERLLVNGTKDESEEAFYALPRIRCTEELESSWEREMKDR